MIIIFNHFERNRNFLSLGLKWLVYYTFDVRILFLFNVILNTHTHTHTQPLMLYWTFKALVFITYFRLLLNGTTLIRLKSGKRCRSASQTDDNQQLNKWSQSIRRFKNKRTSSLSEIIKFSLPLNLLAISIAPYFNHGQYHSLTLSLPLSLIITHSTFSFNITCFFSLSLR